MPGPGRGLPDTGQPGGGAPGDRGGRGELPVRHPALVHQAGLHHIHGAAPGRGEESREARLIALCVSPLSATKRH